MEILIFTKKITKKDGSKFNSYVTKLVKKTGEEVYCTVYFNADINKPKDCPCYIIAEKKDMRYNEKNKRFVDDETGEEKTYTLHNLYVNDYRYSEKEYIDTSMDEFI